MLIKPFFNYRIFIWVLLALAVIMGGVSLVVAYTYRLQKKTELYIEMSRSSVSEAKEMENELTAIKGLTSTYIVNKSNRWLDSLKNRQKSFLFHLERARLRANTPEEVTLIQQISALFSNYEQNVLNAVSNYKMGELNKANALLVHSSQNLLTTIQQKSTEFMTINKRAEIFHESVITRTNVIILRILIFLGFGGIAAGLLLGWLIWRMLFSPITRLILQVRGISGEAVFEQLKLPRGGELDELGERIKDLIGRINKANQDLSKNKELLQYSNKFANLGKIAPTIAHEIRNPLAAIKMLVYSIGEDASLSTELKDDLDIITREIDRIDNFTKDFLRFAKPSDPILKEINPAEPLSEVIKLLNPRIVKNNITLSNNVARNRWVVMADSDQLKQVYMNIILNAIEVMPKGGNLIIDTEKVNEYDINGNGKKRKFLRIDFSDSGPGVPEAILKTVFEPFIKGSDMGVGIGLSISQSIANSHGGWIKAENKTDENGAVFRFYLPLTN